MKAKRVRVQIDLVVTQEDIDDIMSNALDAITYWCDEATVVGDYLGQYASDQISRGGKIMLHDFEEETDHCLDREKFMDGLKAWVWKPVGPDCLYQKDGELRIDPAEADAVVSDAIIQYALFGDVIYG